MHPFIGSGLWRLPTALLEKHPILEREDLNLQRAAALDHLLFAISPEPPQRQVSAGASTLSKAK